MKKLLFVCSGNTCRSPLAEALTRQAAASRNLSLEVTSAGTSAVAGAPASPEAIRAAARRGADLSTHRSRPLQAGILSEADLVVAMTPAHQRIIRTEHGRELNVVLATDYLPPDHARHGEPVSDPFGGDMEEYEEVARLLEQCIEGILYRVSETG